MGYIGDGYGYQVLKEMKQLKMLQSSKVFFFDPTYTGKAFAGISI